MFRNKIIIHFILVTFFSSCMQVKLKDELEFNGQDSSASNTELPNQNDVEEVYETEFIGSRSMNVRFGDYKYLSNFLRSKFGQSCNGVITGNIWNKPEVFGAVCDHYDRTESCNNLKISNPLVLTSTMRSGRMMKTCEEIVANQSCVQYFLNQIGLNNNSNLSDDNIFKAYQFFYPLEEDLDDNQKEAFRGLASQFSNKKDQWKAVELALCLSPNWQIP